MDKHGCDEEENVNAFNQALIAEDEAKNESINGISAGDLTFMVQKSPFDSNLNEAMAKVLLKIIVRKGSLICALIKGTPTSFFLCMHDLVLKN